jgi:hypothetical protein
MTQRGRKGMDELAIAPPADGIPNRPEPPVTLDEAQADLWRSIVEQKPAGWFDSASIPLLAAYCRAVTTCDAVAREINKLGKRCLKEETFARVAKLKKLDEAQAKLMATLATKLRLTQQSRYTPQAADTAARNVAKPKLWEVEK